MYLQKMLFQVCYAFSGVALPHFKKNEFPPAGYIGACRVGGFISAFAH